MKRSLVSKAQVTFRVPNSGAIFVGGREEEAAPVAEIDQPFDEDLDGRWTVLRLCP